MHSHNIHPTPLRQHHGVNANHHKRAIAAHLDAKLAVRRDLLGAERRDRHEQPRARERRAKRAAPAAVLLGLVHALGVLALSEAM